MLGRFVCRGCAVFALASLTSLGLALGCRRMPEPPGPNEDAPRAPGPKPEVSAPSASPLPRVGITWVDPPGLHRVPPTSPTERASYAIPRAAGDTEDGALAVFHVGPGQGDGVDANIERWVKPFSGVAPADVKRVDREANGLHLHTIEIRRGTFDAGPSMGSSRPKKNYALEGAIVEGPSGAYLFKMIGPAHTIAAGRPAFVQLLDSVHIVRADH
jgi:hypothetical protein